MSGTLNSRGADLSNISKTHKRKNSAEKLTEFKWRRKNSRIAMKFWMIQWNSQWEW